jgi:hypothetical protein
MAAPKIAHSEMVEEEDPAKGKQNNQMNRCGAQGL